MCILLLAFRHCINGVLICIPLAFLGQTHLHCGNESDPEQIKFEIQNFCGSDVDCIEDYTQTLLSSSSCFCRQIGQTLDLHFGFNLSVHSREAAAGCDTPYFLYSYTVASKAFGASDYEKAIDWYWEALMDEAPPSACITNIGASYFQLGEYGMAFSCFEDALDNTELSEAESFMVLNNMTAIQMQLGNWNEALQWALVAKNRLSKHIQGYELNHMTIGNEMSALSEANEWLIRMELNDDKFIRQHWKQIHWGSTHLPAEQWIKIILRTGQFLDDPTFQESNIRLVHQLYNEYHSHEKHTVTFGAYHWFLDKLVEGTAPDYMKAVQDWRWVDLLLQESPQNDFVSQSASPTLAQDIDNNVLWTTWAWASTLLLGSLFLMLYLRKKKKGNVHYSNVAGALENLRNWHLGKLSDFAVVQSSLEHLEVASKRNISGWLVTTGVELNEVELIVLRQLLANVPPKKTASQYNWSPNYVYKIRSKLRVKLKAPEDDDLNNWVHRQIHTT